jgi:predicted ArsR family transcriptional regulator
MNDMTGTHGNQKVTDEELLAAFDDIEGPFVTAGELADRLPISRTAINKRLKDLQSRGVIESKKPTKTMVGWWLSDGNQPPEAT